MRDRARGMPASPDRRIRTSSTASCIAASNVRDSHDGVDQADGGRIPHRLPELDLFAVEREVVLTAGVADAVVVREKRLHDGLAAYFASTRAAGDLRQQLKRPLARRGNLPGPRPTSAEITPDERDTREVVALREHLRADEDVELARREPRRAAPAIAPRRRMVSRSTRSTACLRKPGARSPPRPARCRSRLARGTRQSTSRMTSAPGWRSCSSGSARAAPRGAPSANRLQFGHSSVEPHCRHTTDVANPRRFRRTIACSPTARRAVERFAESASSGSRQALQQRTPPACPRPARRRAADRARASRASNSA